MIKQVAALYFVALLVHCIAALPNSYRAEVARGYDATIYYEAGRGNTAYLPHGQQIGEHRSGWVYSDRLLPVVGQWARLPFPTAYLILYLANSLAAAALGYAAISRCARYPILGGLAAAGVGWFATDVVSTGNVHAMLAGLALTPIGALVACAFKPWYGAAFLVVHAIRGAAAGGSPGLRWVWRIPGHATDCVLVDRPVSGGVR